MLGKSDAHVALDWFVASWDGKYVAYGISVGGSENSTLHVVESATGKVLADAIDRSQYAAVSWRPDNRSFFHLRLQKVAGECAADRRLPLHEALPAPPGRESRRGETTLRGRRGPRRGRR